ncbi:MAG TPA: Crp/Fnr family transcriptional regulator [Candidatus Parabacteroides intestinavium]|nr:Crp/Fnr family transcriptional regulator [Candidatus Parabacteroides intestinavium]
METALHIAQKLTEQTVSVSREALEKLASILVKNEIKKGQNFLNEGEVCTQMGYVYKGLVRQYYYKNGKEMTEHFCCEEGVFICIESFLRQKPSRLVVEALENTIIYGIPHDPILKLAEECYEIEKVYRGLLENSLILSQVKMDMFRFESANERYNRLLREQPEIVRRAPLSYIASFLLMTPETLSRVRANVI